MAEQKKSRAKKLAPAELSLFCTQVALFLEAGIAPVEGLSLLREDVGDPYFQGVLDGVCRAVEERRTLTDALTETGAFPAYLLRMVSVGEVSGNLDEMMKNLSRYYEREQNLRQRIKRSVTYPLVLILMMSAVVLLLVVQVLPMFDSLLRSLGNEMPPFVAGLLSFGNFVGKYWWLIAAVVLALYLAYRLWKRTPGGRNALDAFKARFFITRSVYQKIAAERFASAMTFLLRSGVELELSLELARDILGNAHMSRKIEIARVRISEGQSFHDALAEAGIFPRLFTRMLGLGSKTGGTDEIMQKLEDIYEQEVDTSLHRITGAIEPTFVALLSIVVGVILVSVMLPLIRVMSSIG